MKKIIIPIILCLIICGCKGESKVPVNIKSASFELYMSYYNEKFLFDVKTEDSFENVYCCVKSPEDLKDMKFTVNKDGMTVDYMGLSYTPNKKSTISCVVDVFYGLLCDIEGKEAIKEENNYFVCGKIDGYDYSVCFSPNGLPLYFEIEKLNTKGEFRNLTLVN